MTELTVGSIRSSAKASAFARFHGSDIIEFFGGAVLEIADVHQRRLRSLAAAAHATGKEFEYSLWLFDEVRIIANQARTAKPT